LDIYDFKEHAFSKKEEKPEPKLQYDSPQTDNVKVNNINTINNNDAALIPLSHLTRNYSKGDYGVDMGATF